jgi:hypothetical protein
VVKFYTGGQKSVPIGLHFEIEIVTEPALADFDAGWTLPRNSMSESER